MFNTYVCVKYMLKTYILDICMQVPRTSSNNRNSAAAGDECAVTKQQ